MFVFIRSYDNYLPANIMLQRLEEEGIRAYLQDEHTVTIDPLLSNAIGGIKLMVHNSQAERAELLARSYEQEYLRKGACPVCGSGEVENMRHELKLQGWFDKLINYLTGKTPEPRESKAYHCTTCHHNFEDPGIP